MNAEVQKNIRHSAVLYKIVFLFFYVLCFYTYCMVAADPDTEM